MPGFSTGFFCPKNSRNCPPQPVTIHSASLEVENFFSNPTSLNAICKKSTLNTDGFVQHLETTLQQSLTGKAYVQQHRNNDAEARSTQCHFHSFPTQTFTCSKTCSRKAGRHSMAIAMGQHNKQAMLFRKTAYDPWLCHFWYFTEELRGILQGGLEYFAWPLHTLPFTTQRHLPPSLFCTQKSVIVPATPAFPKHFIMLRHTQSQLQLKSENF